MNLLVIAAVLSSLYGNAQKVEIEGFSADAQEPCISLDGQTLYWSGKNDSDATAHIYWAKRVSDLKFKYVGRLDSVLTKKREMAPAVDSNGRLYFTATEKFGDDHRTIYWTKDGQRGQAVMGDISDGCGVDLLKMLVTLNMDCGVSPDGNTLVIARANFAVGATVPHKSKLFIARKQPDGSFRREANSDAILREVNSTPLQYAPAISADGLELYFTRLTLDRIPTTETMVATRSSGRESFGKPVRLTAIEGFAEAPSLTLDRKELYVHRLDPVSKRFFICQLKRQR